MRTLVAPLLCCVCLGANAQLNNDLTVNPPAADPTSLVRPTDIPRVLPSEAVPFQFVMVYDDHGRNVMSTGPDGISMQDLDSLDPGNYLVVATDERGQEIDREELAIMRY
jgi:hypothetical protein